MSNNLSFVGDERVYNARVTAFFKQYVTFPPGAFAKDGTLLPSSVDVAIKLLLDNGIFASPRDIQIEAIRKLRVLLPDSMFGNTEGK